MLAEFYQEATEKLFADLKINRLALPRVEKVLVSVGLGPNIGNKEIVESIEKELALITGQKPKKTTAKKSISGFKIRQNQHIGFLVTLRGKRMWQFIYKLINIVYPRIRDFDGIPTKSIDTGGNLNIAIREQLVFPEIKPDEIKATWGMTITLSLNKNTKVDVAKNYYTNLGFIFKEL